MLCSYERVIYPQSLSDPNPTGFMVAVYTPHEKILDSSGQALRQVKAVGYFLPTAKGIRYEMQGRWERGKHGDQYAVTQFEEVIQPTEAGIIAYLSSGYIKGIGEKTARRIYEHFGDKALDILDREPKRLLEVRGISPKKLERISDSYMETRGARDIITLLSPFGIAPKRAVRFFKIYGRDAADIIRQHPYRLCEVRGIGFKTADEIAKSVGFDPCGEERIDAALLHVLKEAENGGSLFKNAGNLCIPKVMLLAKCIELLETPAVTEPMVRLRCRELLDRKEITLYQDQAYRYLTAKAEEQVAMRVRERIRQGDLSILEDVYLQRVKELGLDNVILLSPYRTKTATGVNALNSRLRDKLNPPSVSKSELTYGKRIFRQGDKVMQTQNVANISNGDIGIVTGILHTQEESTLYVDFGDGRTMEYAPNELDMLDLAYATTVHKSQGSEYDTVILSLQTAHYIMLRRPLLYTAITRAKRHVVIVGERKALVIAIGRVDAEKRGTMLAERINEAEAKAINV